MALASQAPADDWATPRLSIEEYRKAARRYRQRRWAAAVPFLTPYLVPFVVFLAIPCGWSVYLSFHTGGIIGPAQFVGLQNWSRALHSQELHKTIENTLKFLVLALAALFVLAMGLALIMNRYTRARSIFRPALYFPLLAPPILGALVWQFLVQFDFGIFNLSIRTFGGTPVNILGSATLALLTIVAIDVWRGLGFWTLYFLTSLESVPQDLTDAARVDGASAIRRFRKITLPVLRPLLLFALVIATIFHVQVFEAVFALTGGGPGGATSTVVWFIWNNMFSFGDTGLAYATSVGLMLFILLLTVVAFRMLGGRRRRRQMV